MMPAIEVEADGRGMRADLAPSGGVGPAPIFPVLNVKRPCDRAAARFALTDQGRAVLAALPAKAA